MLLGAARPTRGNLTDFLCLPCGYDDMDDFRIAFGILGYLDQLLQRKNENLNY